MSIKIAKFKISWLLFYIRKNKYTNFDDIDTKEIRR